MKQTSQQILELINDKDLNDAFNGHVSAYPDFIHGDTTITEAFSKFNLVKEILNISISNSHFDTLPANKRNSILSSINGLKAYITNPEQTIIQVDLLYNEILGSELLIQQLNKRDYLKEFKRISELRVEFEQIKDDIINKKHKLDAIDVIYKDTIEKKNEVDQVKIAIDNILIDAQEKDTRIYSIQESLISIQSTISYAESDIEAKKLSIMTFAKNIEEYKVGITALEVQAKQIIDKEATINLLINQAETALNLKSAEGISAAFSAQYSNASKKWGLRTWIIGAVAFMIIAIILTVWIVSGKGISNPDSISSIIGRIIAVGIAITGATFCAKQYTKQKNIAEDYAYKAVLAKSIIAFTEEIKKRDDAKVVEYLERVLNEIHQDPLRKRDEKEDSDNLTRPLAILEKLMDKISPK